MAIIGTTVAKRALATSCGLALLLTLGCQSNGQTRPTSGPTTGQLETAAPNDVETNEQAAPAPDVADEPSAPEAAGVSTSNGGFTLYPVGEWDVTVEKLKDAYEADHDPVERFLMTHPASEAEGEILVGEITSADKFEDRIENLNSYRVEDLDAPAGQTVSLGDAETYIIEYINQSAETKRYVWRMSIVSKSKQMGSEFDAGVFFTARKPGTIAEMWLVADQPGEAGKEEVEQFADSKIRDDALAMLQGLSVEQEPVQQAP